MNDFWHLAEVLPNLSLAQLAALVVLAAFGLAAFAIHVVSDVAKGKRK